jgi:DNA (cytosine-5)-methyltransferase 1
MQHKSHDECAKRITTAMLSAARRRGSFAGATIGEAVQLLKRDLASNLPDYWLAAKSNPKGAIDVIDMFSGCGGMSSGFVAVNALFPAFRHILAIDIDEVANKSYDRNLGLKPVSENISALAASPAKLLKLVKDSGRRENAPLVLIGCAPCQGFSSHRNAAGASDDRNSLFTDFARVAACLTPDAIVIENVPEILTHKFWPYVAKARRILERSGYSVHLGVHNMAGYGVAQERFRAVMVALKHSFRPLAPFVPRSQFRTVRQTIGKLPRIIAGQRTPEDVLHYTANHAESTLATIKAVPKNGGSRPEGVGPRCLVKFKERQGRGAYDDVYGRLFWDKPAITITASARNPASGRFVHPTQNRGLSIREAALLQGFPDDYWFAGGLDDAFRQIGNAVPPIFASSLALHLLGELFDPLRAHFMDPGIVEPVGASFSRLIPSLKAEKDELRLSA